MRREAQLTHVSLIFGAQPGSPPKKKRPRAKPDSEEEGEEEDEEEGEWIPSSQEEEDAGGWGEEDGERRADQMTPRMADGSEWRAPGRAESEPWL